jgi:Arc/MetJ-type ribon-helix-helix transcriptional regulator
LPRAPPLGMMFGMTHAKIAVTLPEELVASARMAVKRGDAKNVSAYIASAVREKVQASDLKTLLEEMLEESGGPPRPAEREGARRALGLAPLGKRRKR